MTIKTLLDDAAAHATTDEPIDLALALTRVQVQRRHTRAARYRGGVALLSVAAVVALIAVLLPAGSLMRGDRTPAGEPSSVPAETGIPDRWYYAPVWTPPVTRHAMAAAVMVLSAPLAGALDRGPVLVSADARTYAALPDWGPDDGGVSLIADGTKVAWWTAPENAPVVVHLLTLRNGVQHDVTIDRLTPSSMVWRLGDVYISGRATTSGGPQGTYRISADGRTRTKVCGCAPGQLGTDTKGLALRTSTGGQDQAALGGMSYPPTRPNQAAEQASGGITAPFLISSPDGFRSASVVAGAGDTWTMQLRSTDAILDFAAPGPPAWQLDDQDFPVSADEPIESVRVLGWTEAGIFIQVDTRKPGYSLHRSIRLMYLRNGRTNTISRAMNSQTVPVAIAPGLVPTQDPISAPPVTFDTWDRAHLSFLRARAWDLYAPWILLAGAVLTLTGAGVTRLVVRRRRRGRLRMLT